MSVLLIVGGVLIADGALLGPETRGADLAGATPETPLVAPVVTS